MNIPFRYVPSDRSAPCFVRRAGILIAVSLSAFQLFSFSARAQVTPTTLFSLTNLPGTIRGAGVSNLFTSVTTTSNNVISLAQGTGLGVGMLFNGNANTAVSNLSLFWVGSYDGTNWFTNSPVLFTLLGPGTNAAMGSSNFPATTLNNWAYLAPYLLSNNCLANTNFFLSNIWVSRSAVGLPNY